MEVAVIEEGLNPMGRAALFAYSNNGMLLVKTKIGSSTIEGFR
jgi:hypothetical protein